jgi:putative endonuclease
MFFVYFIESIKRPRVHYIGYSENIKKRLKQHNLGLVKSTSKFKPWKLIYAEIYTNKKDAYGREKFLKSGSGWKYLKKQLYNYLNHHENLKKEKKTSGNTSEV